MIVMMPFAHTGEAHGPARMNNVAFGKDLLTDRAKSPGLVWYAIGRDDIFAKTVAPTRALLDRYQVHYVFHDSPGSHTWQNWRDYLTLFAPMLFR